MNRIGKRLLRKTPWVSLLLLFCGFLLLNAVLTLFLWYPGYEFLRILSPSMETAVIFALLLLLGFAAVKKSRWIVLFLSILLLVYFLYGFGEGLKQHAFRRPFVPWTDLEFIPALFNMVFQTGAFGKIAVLAIGGSLLFALLTAAFYLLLRGLEKGIRRIGPWNAGALAVVFLIMGIVLGFGRPLTAVIAGQLKPPPPVSMELLRTGGVSTSSMSTTF